MELLWPAQARAARKPFVLRVLFVEVQDTKDPLGGMHKDFLKAARLVVRKKFGIKIDWKIIDPVDSRELFFRARDSTALHWAQKMKFDLESEALPEVMARGLDFLAEIRSQDLISFFPSLADKGQNLDETKLRQKVQVLLAEAMSKKAKKLQSFLGPKLRGDQNSAMAWMAACYEDSRAEVYITPAALLYDDQSRPHPHRIMAAGPMGGTSLEIKSGGFHEGRGVLVSSFWSVETAGLLRGDGTASMGKRQKAELLGKYILGHELGHMIFKIPDFYDHPDECLMTTRPSDMDPISGLKRLDMNPGRCPKCQPYISMMVQHWKGEESRQKQDWDLARRYFEKALALAPDKLDGGATFPSKIYLRLMDVYLALERIDKAIEMVDRFIESNPENLQAQEIRISLIGLHRESNIEP